MLGGRFLETETSALKNNEPCVWVSFCIVFKNCLIAINELKMTAQPHARSCKPIKSGKWWRGIAAGRGGGGGVSFVCPFLEPVLLQASAQLYHTQDIHVKESNLKLAVATPRGHGTFSFLAFLLLCLK